MCFEVLVLDTKPIICRVYQLNDFYNFTILILRYRLINISFVKTSCSLYVQK